MIPGLHVEYGFVGRAEEQEILRHTFADYAAPPDKGRKLRNRVSAFFRGVDRASPIPTDAKRSWVNAEFTAYFFPPPLTHLASKVVDAGFLERVHMIAVNEYLAGQTITPHVDHKINGSEFCVVSLLSDTCMVMTRPAVHAEFASQMRTVVFLPRGSIAHFSGEARWEWKHAIPEITAQRYSLVIRPLIDTLLEKP